jgi:hypothetical protein
MVHSCRMSLSPFFSTQQCPNIAERFSFLQVPSSDMVATVSIGNSNRPYTNQRAYSLAAWSADTNQMLRDAVRRQRDDHPGQCRCWRNDWCQCCSRSTGVFRDTDVDMEGLNECTSASHRQPVSSDRSRGCCSSTTRLSRLPQPSHKARRRWLAIISAAIVFTHVRQN